MLGRKVGDALLRGTTPEELWHPDVRALAQSLDLVLVQPLPRAPASLIVSASTGARSLLADVARLGGGDLYDIAWVDEHRMAVIAGRA